MTAFNDLPKNTPLSNIVPFNADEDKLLLLDFTSNNTSLTDEILEDISAFSLYVKTLLANAGAKYGIGGYNENRTVYDRSKVFNTDDEPRRLHIGLDIWGEIGTPVFAPLPGQIHSFAYNDQFGDYGATIILQHHVNNITFHTLYGHLSLKDLNGLYKGKPVVQGQQIATFGDLYENGQWPPHLHFQIIMDMEGMKGDYPGVCKSRESGKYLSNCPDPDIILDMMKFAIE